MYQSITNDANQGVKENIDNVITEAQGSKQQLTIMPEEINESLIVEENNDITDEETNAEND